METNDNENVTIQNLWDATKAVLRGKFIVIQAFLKKEEKSQKKKETVWIQTIIFGMDGQWGYTA